MSGLGDRCINCLLRKVNRGCASRNRLLQASGMGFYRLMGLAWQMGHCDEKEIERCVGVLTQRGRTDDKAAARADIRREWLWHGVAPSEYLAWRFDEKPQAKRRAYYSLMDQVRFTSVLNDREAADVLVDKYKTYLKFRNQFGREVFLFDGNNAEDVLSSGFPIRHPEFFAKPLTGFGGHGTRRVKMVDLDAGSKSLGMLLSEIGSCVLEEPIRQHPATEAFHPASLNTVRLATLSDGVSEDTECWFAFFRCGRGKSTVDNTHSGGVFAQIDVTTGTVCTDACDLAGDGYARHPDSNRVFCGFEVPHWNEMTALVKKLAGTLPACRYISWDLAATPDGVALVEANTQGDLALEQAVQGVGLKAKYEEVLNLWISLSRGKKSLRFL